MSSALPDLHQFDISQVVFHSVSQASQKRTLADVIFGSM
jgi:hypothetical protein